MYRWCSSWNAYTHDTRKGEWKEDMTVRSSQVMYTECSRRTRRCLLMAFMAK